MGTFFSSLTLLVEFRIKNHENQLIMKSFQFVLSAFFAFAFCFTLQAQTASSSAHTPDFNRSVEDLQLGKDRNGRQVLRMKIGLFVFEKETRRMNMSFDIVVKKNGVPFHKFPQNLVSNDAVICAVTCASKCGSIFGDGVCSGCGCNYAQIFNLPIASAASGDVFEVHLVPARGGEKDSNPRDDARRVQFNSRVGR